MCFSHPHRFSSGSANCGSEVCINIEALEQNRFHALAAACLLSVIAPVNRRELANVLLQPIARRVTCPNALGTIKKVAIRITLNKVLSYADGSFIMSKAKAVATLASPKIVEWKGGIIEKTLAITMVVTTSLPISCIIDGVTFSTR